MLVSRALLGGQAFGIPIYLCFICFLIMCIVCGGEEKEAWHDGG